MGEAVFPPCYLKESESEVAQLCPTLCDPVDCSLSGSSVHGILQVRILEWVAISFSRGSSWPRDWTQVSCIAGRCFNLWATREAPMLFTLIQTMVKVMKIMETSFKVPIHTLLHSVPPNLQQATADPCLCWRLLDTHVQVWFSLLCAHCSFLLRLNLIDRVPEELWMEVCDIVQETGIKTIPPKKEMQNGKMVVWRGLTENWGKKKSERQRRKGKIYPHLNAEFQRIARRDKKAFLSDQCKEIEANSRMGKTRAMSSWKLEIQREYFMQRWAQ